MLLNVYIGTEDDQLIPQKVLEYSIRKNASRPVNIVAIKQNVERVGGTNFGFVRFLVPKLNGYKGRAIYLDADQLVFADIYELADLLDDAASIGLVTEPTGFFGGRSVGQHNQSSVMVLDCDKLRDWNPDNMFNCVVPNRASLLPGQIHYRDFMMLSWVDQNRIKSIDPAWNHFNIVQSDTKITHFSHVRSQPWRSPSHPLTQFWRSWLREAVHVGAVRRKDLIVEAWRGSIHWHFLSCCF